MKKHIFAVFFMTLVFGCGVYGQVDTPVVSKEGRFTVVPPKGFDKFQLSTQANSPESGGGTSYLYDMGNERGYCSITYFDLPPRDNQDSFIQSVLNGARDGSLKAAHAILDSQEQLTVDGYPALSFTVHIVDKDNAASYGHVVAIVANWRLYSFIFIGASPAELAKPDVQKFFSSIHIQK